VQIYPRRSEKSHVKAPGTVAVLSVLLLLVVLVSGAASNVPLDTASSRADLVITEFMAVNDSTLVDEDGDHPDWIEIHNAGAGDVDLGGWYLTDNRDRLTKWRFPSTLLAAGGYLVVFASDKDRAVSGAELHTNFRLDHEGEYLALVRPDGKRIAWEYASAARLPHFANVSYGLDAAGNERYLAVPTPGRDNGSEAANAGPVLAGARHVPSLPAAGEPITVTVRAQASLLPIEAVVLHYRVMYRDEAAVPMLDDSAHGDDAAGDGTYGAVIPGDGYGPGEMVRYYVTAVDAQEHASRWPLFQDPTNSPEYQGTMAADPSVNSLLPVLYWFVQDPAAAETRSGTRASVFYDGVLYDNVLVRIRGAASKDWPKQSFKFDFNQGYHFKFAPGEDPVEEFNLNSTSSDRAYVRQPLAWDTYRDAGVPSCISFPMRVQQNGAFYNVTIFIEQPDEKYLAREGLDPQGALYKMKLGSTLTLDFNDPRKRTRLDEDNADLQALLEGINLSGEAQTDYLFDHVNIPEILNYQAVATILQDRDQGHNNYYLYRDTEGTGEWMFLPWDKDLTFGLTFDQGLNLDVIADVDSVSGPFSGYRYNRLIKALYSTPATREMFLRRLRTVMDEFLQPPGTPVNERYFETRIDKLFTQMQLDVVLDAERWPDIHGTPQTFADAVSSIKTDYLDARRVYLYETQGPPGGGVIPGPQPATTRLRFGDVGYAASSQDPDEEYLAVINPNDYAVDVSGWRLAGSVQYTFQPGVVIPSGGTLYVSPDVVAFRDRAASPIGGEGRFVQGDYAGRVSNAGGILWLYNDRGMLIAGKVFLDTGSFRLGAIAGGTFLLVLAVAARRIFEVSRTLKSTTSPIAR
jgi:hypothetical protein